MVVVVVVVADELEVAVGG